jgi:hypothetical protein
MREKKGCPRERNLREIYTENPIMFCRLSVFVLFLLTHNWIRTNGGGGGAQNFLGPRGVKYLNTGLDILFNKFTYPCCFSKFVVKWNWPLQYFTGTSTTLDVLVKKNTQIFHESHPRQSFCWPSYHSYRQLLLLLTQTQNKTMMYLRNATPCFDSALTVC